MHEWIEWAQTEAGRWWWAVLGAIGAGILALGRGLFVTWRWLHDLIVTSAIQAGDRAVLDRLDAHERRSDLLVAEYQHRFDNWSESHENLKAYVEQIKATVKDDVDDIRGDIKVVRERTDQHTIILGRQDTKLEAIHETVLWLRDQWGKDNGTRHRKDDPPA